MTRLRYPLLSVATVFLALSVGAAVGAQVMRGPVNGDLSRLTTQNRSLTGSVAQLEGQATAQAAFARQAAPRLLRGTLAGRTVALIALPGARPADVTAVSGFLGQAGATVAANVTVSAALVDPARSAEVKDLVVRVLDAAPGVQVAPGDDAAGQAGTVLAAALLTSPGVNLPAANRTTILTGFVSLGLLQLAAPVSAGAAAAVLVAGPPAVGARSAATGAALLSFVRRTAAAGPTVLAAPAAGGTGNVLAAAQSDRSLGDTVSTVDAVSTPPGQIAVPLALAAQLAGRVGHYGTGPRDAGLLPPSG